MTPPEKLTPLGSMYSARATTTIFLVAFAVFAVIAFIEAAINTCAEACIFGALCTSAAIGFAVLFRCQTRTIRVYRDEHPTARQ